MEQKQGDVLLGKAMKVSNGGSVVECVRAPDLKSASEMSRRKRVEQFGVSSSS